MNLIQKAKGAIANKRALFAAAMATPMLAFADNDISSIGTTAATEIAKFAIMITAIGTAVLSDPRLPHGISHDQNCELIKRGLLNGLQNRLSMLRQQRSSA